VAALENLAFRLVHLALLQAAHIRNLPWMFGAVACFLIGARLAFAVTQVLPLRILGYTMMVVPLVLLGFGFWLSSDVDYSYSIPLEDVAGIWRNGSRRLELASNGSFNRSTRQCGHGQWTVHLAELLLSCDSDEVLKWRFMKLNKLATGTRLISGHVDPIDEWNYDLEYSK
jgi:hypothetical protein